MDSFQKNPISSALLLGLLALFFLLFMNLYRSGYYGWDLKTSCACLASVKANENPYRHENVAKYANTGQSCSYQAPAYWLMQPFCPSETGSLAFWISPSLGVFLSILAFRARLIPAVAVLGGFAGVLSISVTSSPLANLEFLLFGVFWWLLRTGRKSTSAFVLGALASFKLISLSFCLGLLYWGRNFFLKAAFTAGVFLFLAFTYEPIWFRDYFFSLAGLIPNNPHSISLEFYSGGANPTLLIFLKDLLVLYPGTWSFLFLIWSFGLVALLGRKIILSWKARRLRHSLVSYAYWVFFIFLLLPRTKPHFYAFLVFPLIEILISLPRQKSLLLLIFSALIPLLLFHNNLFNHIHQNVFQLLYNNHLVISLLITLTLILWLTRSSRGFSPAGPSAKGQ